MLTLAIVGRPNVGKSTLFNRLTRTPFALVDDQPGVTRDRREGVGHIGPLEFLVFDTAGLEEAPEQSLQARMTGQTLSAVKEADMALFVIDGRAGLTPMDKAFAHTIRKENIPVVLLVNKAEGNAATHTYHEAYGLGFGEPIAISAAHGEGLGELYDVLIKHPKAHIPDEDEEEMEEAPRAEGEEEEIVDPILNIAIVGRPNAGKSTLINCLLGKERLLTGPEAGITRDAIAVPFTYKDKELKLVDTAGMRKKANIDEKLEKMAVQDSLRAIQYAHVVIIMVDATQPLEKQDINIAALVEKEGRAMVLAVNKWDQVKDQAGARRQVEDRLQTGLPHVRGIPVVYISGLKGKGLDKLMQAAFTAYGVWNKRISTNMLNRWLEYITAEHSPPMIEGKRLKFRYITQAKARPPSFMIASNLSEIPDHYTRYLINGLREHFQLPGVPIRIKFKKGKNPYADEKK